MRKRQDPNIEGLDRTIEVPLPGGRSVRVLPLSPLHYGLMVSGLRKGLAIDSIPTGIESATNMVANDGDKTIVFTRLALLMTCATVGMVLYDPSVEFETAQPRNLSRLSAGEWVAFAESIEGEIEGVPGRFLLSVDDASAVAALLQKSASDGLADEKNG